jgi:2-polyprenyl-3-methyl-5-hydroxy-6-metoxy-1,4-benzoquinol methylase
MRDFAPIAEDLGRAVVEHYAARHERLEGQSGLNTLVTNSTLVERRGTTLIRILKDGRGESLEGLRLADIGCGFGALAVFFAARGGTITAFDPNAERFAVGRAVAERHTLPVEWHQGFMQTHRLPADAFDIAVMNNSLCYLVDPAARQAALRLTREALRPGGRLIIRDPNLCNPRDQFTGLPGLHWLGPARAARAAARLGRPRSSVRLRSPLGLRRELRRAGFARIEHPGFVDSNRPDALKWVANYQHVVAARL